MRLFLRASALALLNVTFIVSDSLFPIDLTAGEEKIEPPHKCMTRVYKFYESTFTTHVHLIEDADSFYHTFKFNSDDPYRRDPDTNFMSQLLPHM
jgi:hypothetical protein